MDPKALDHLDPKQKEAYDRIMGHAAGTTDGTAQAPDQTMAPPSPEPAFNASLDSLSSSPISTDFNSSPLDTPIDATAGDQPQFYTPGQESPSQDKGLSATPTDPNQLSDQLTGSPFASSSFGGNENLGTEPQATDAQDNLAPPNSSFFTNPSPEVSPPPPGNETLSTSLSPEPEGIPASSPDNFSPGTPVTPYTPSEVPNLAPATGTFAQPLPSPASVHADAPHETSPLLRVLYIIGAVVFFAVYTIFWIKVFNLPFLF